MRKALWGLLVVGLLLPVRAGADITNFALALPSGELRILDGWAFVHVGPLSHLHAVNMATDSVVNLNLVATAVGSIGDTVYFYVLEGHQNADLNGDGDRTDFVFHTFHRTSGAITNLRIAQSGVSMSSIPMSASLLAFLTSENAEIRNHNGDGDFNDHVVRVIDTATATARTLPYAVGFSPFPAPGDEMVAIAVDEASQGFIGLNGDGDTLDRVLHVHDLRTGVTTNVGLAAFSILAVGRHVVFGVFEGAQGGVDRNGDGDAFDTVLHVYDLDAGTVTNTGLATGLFHSVDDLVLFQVSEAAQSEDLNADLDTIDSVLHRVDPATALTTNLGFSLANAELRSQAGLAFFSVSESDHGDLNGDGDAGDGVLHIYSSGTITNLGVAASAFRGSATRIATSVMETAQGNVDLNGDGDANDAVLYVFDRLSGVWTNVRRHSVHFDVSDGLIIFQVPEAESATDLNGDGDAVDVVYFAHDPVAITTENLRLAGRQGAPTLASASFIMGAAGDSAVFIVHEALQGADLNGDGSRDDEVLHLARPPFAANIEPLADAGQDVTLILGETGSFDGTGSTDADGFIAQFEWHFGDGTVGTGPIVQHAYAAPGSFVTKLIVTDSQGAAASDTVAVRVLTPAQAIAEVKLIVAAFNLSQGISNSFDAKLEAAQGALEAANAGMRQDAANKLEAFIQAVTAQRGKEITTLQADELIGWGYRVLAVL